MQLIAYNLPVIGTWPVSIYAGSIDSIFKVLKNQRGYLQKCKS